MMAMGKYWRIFATFVSFLIFGLGGLIFPLIARPLLWIFVRDTAKRNRLGKSCIHYSFRAFVEIMQFLGVLKYKVSGLERLSTSGNLILANHPTLIDVVMLIAFIKNADCVVKSSLFKNPATSGPILMAGYIANNSPLEVVEQAAHSLKQGNNVIIFPEGTRTKSNEVLKLKRGAANIALTANADITPAIIQCNPPALSKEQNWYDAANSRVVISIGIQNVINIDTFAQQERTSHSSRQLTRYLEWYFSEALSLQ